jgi:hypothetical protein
MEMMCELCNPETREQELKNKRYIAGELKKLAAKYDAMADGFLEPHSEQAKIMGMTATAVIHDLVVDWL